MTFMSCTIRITLLLIDFAANFYNLTQTPVVNFTVDRVSDSGDRREVLLTCDLPDKENIPGKRYIP